MTRRAFYGLHLQDSINDWPIFYEPHFGLGVFKSVMAFERCAEAKVRNPAIITIARQYVAHQGQYLERCTDGWGAMGAAEDYIKTFRDAALALGSAVDYWESLNETYSHDWNDTRRGVLFDWAFAVLFPAMVPCSRPLVFTAAIGNPDLAFLPAMRDIGLFDAVLQSGGVMGYHTYWPVYYGHSFVGDPNVARDLHMRWAEIDAWLVGKGYKLPWLPTEAGPVGCNNPADWAQHGYGLRAPDGWRHGSVWGGALPGYINDLDTWRQMLIATPAYQRGHYLGDTHFTSGGGEMWQNFELTTGDWQVLANHAAQSAPLPAPAPPPPPPPPPLPGATTAP